MTSSPLIIELTNTPDPAEKATIAEAMLAYNETFLGGPDSKPLAVLVKSPDVVGGVWGRTSHQWLFIEMLYLPENLRGRHLGQQLLHLAEREARGRGCVGAWLDTFSEPARRFYERQGYEPFGQLNDYPPGHTRVFLRRSFAPQVKCPNTDSP